MTATATAKKPAEAAVKKSRKKDYAGGDHPSTLGMIREAIEKMGGTKGASLYAIKKYISDVYKLDMARTVPLIRRVLKKAVEDKGIIQLKGIGASGSFKLGVEKKGKAAKKPEVKKAAKKSEAKKTGKKPEAKKTVKRPESKKADAPKKSATETAIPSITKAKSKTAATTEKAKKRTTVTKPKADGRKKADTVSKAAK